ncbi:MAG: hypothetical protein C0407_18575, partial [Desulfobacca sp.]|nr:hypothetical protein [Desulfobacca sp.]
NVPSVEIGRATLTGSWSGGANTINVSMNDMIFLAPNTGDRPSIWSTNNVSGTYAGNPAGANVALSGGGANLAGLKANFNVQQWDTTGNKWLSTVNNGTGSYSNYIDPKTIDVKTGKGIASTVPISFQGAAAGSIAPGKIGGTFSGTAAGTAR